MISRFALLVFATLLAGCENVSFGELGTAAGGGASAAAVSLVTTHPAVLAGAAVGGGLTVAAMTDEAEAVTAEQIAEVQNPWQAFVLAFDQLLQHAFEIVIAIGIATIGLPMLISYVMGRAKQRPEDAKQIRELVNKVGKMKE